MQFWPNVATYILILGGIFQKFLRKSIAVIIKIKLVTVIDERALEPV